MFSEILKRLRAERGISQAELAARLNVVQQTVAKWEANVAAPGVAVMKEIALFFGVTTDYLLEMPAIKPPAADALADFPKDVRVHMGKYCTISRDGRTVVDATLEAIWQQECGRSGIRAEKKEIS